MIRRLLKLALVLLAVGQIAATCNGTETGNPGVPSEQPGGSEGGGTTGGTGGCPAGLKSQTDDADRDAVVDDLILDLCHKIILCGVPTTTDTCVNALNGAAGDRLTDELGLAPDAFTIESLRAALNDGAFTFDSASFSSCETAIGSVDCSVVSANVTAADFSGTENIVPDSCVTVFGPVSNDSTGGPSAGCP